MIKKLGFLLAIISVVIIFFCYPTHALAQNMDSQNNRYIQIDFGSAEAVEPLTKTKTFSTITLDKQITGYEISYDQGLVNRQTGATIPPERLKLFVNEREVPLLSETTTIDKPGSEGLRIRMTLELLPLDPVGFYEGIITLKPWKKNNNEPNLQEWLPAIMIMFSVHVNPWVRLEPIPAPIVLERPYLTAHTLQNPEPVYLRIASNSTWNLSAELVSTKSTDKTGLSVPLTIKVTETPGADFLILLTPNAGPRFILSGNATVDRTHYWRKIPITFFLTDITSYPAGFIRFELVFTGEPYNK